jgi:hypothetical protein
MISKFAIQVDTSGQIDNTIRVSVTLHSSIRRLRDGKRLSGLKSREMLGEKRTVYTRWRILYITRQGQLKIYDKCAEHDEISTKCFTIPRTNLNI